jgi:uncharacterized protein (TIGR02246 family)
MSALASQLQAIDRTRDNHVAALNANDAEAWVRCFAAQGVQMPPNDAANIGIDSIRAWSTGMLSGFRVEFSLDVEELELTGDTWAFERGGYAIALTPAVGGAPICDSGKYITIYEGQADGSWLIARDIWNSNQRLPAHDQGSSGIANGSLE